jgi:hypothetical protein
LLSEESENNLIFPGEIDLSCFPGATWKRKVRVGAVRINRVLISALSPKLSRREVLKV